MSGSNSGDPPDEPGDTDREQRDRSAGTSQPPPAAEEPSRNDPPAATASEADADGVTIEDDGVLRWFLHTDDETVVMARDVLSSVAIVAAVGLLLFAVSGIWPPLVAVESGSMEPNMHKGDLIFVVDDDRFVGDNPAAGTGVVTLENGQESGHEKFGNPGDVIVYQPNGDPSEIPVIHRAHFWVEEDENWVETKASEEIVGDATCTEIATCPAEHAGFVTKGDANDGYDQYGNGISDIVKPEWVTGKAMYRIPWLGNVRLTFDKLLGGMLVPTSPSSQSLQDPTAATVTPAGADAPGFGGDGDLAVAAGLASVGAGAAVAVGRSRR
ncbi:S24/S26 family peptidase [Natrinema versiforme]|uniref:Peptidase S26B, signal peptidase n=1 Tax=Natrinema versiforme JCM 10478 TaxID=1227496 RepID=L9XVN7_9EURY|nr:S26 family signal peptidase [Natrinema versiforme]ELY65547.1 peptidase S26B, signal peptidase [Natrinema versiforme JCM 10478]